jgi:excisionase family DNA binding protein
MKRILSREVPKGLSLTEAAGSRSAAGAAGGTSAGKAGQTGTGDVPAGSSTASAPLAPSLPVSPSVLTSFSTDCSGDTAFDPGAVPVNGGSFLGRLLTVAELSRRINVKRKTIYDWVARRRIPYLRLEGSLRFPEVLIERWVAARVRVPFGFK